MKRLIVSCTIVASFLCTSAAYASDVTRSASALPTVQAKSLSLYARRSVALKKKSHLQAEGAGAAAGAGGGLSTTALIIGGVAVVGVVGGVVVVTNNASGG